MGLGGGEASKDKLKDTIFPMTNLPILGVFRSHAQKEYGKVWEIKSIPILNILALLFFFITSNAFTQSGLNGTQYKDVK